MNKKQPSPAFRTRQAAFSMVEMIGVLAIIAILAVIIVPKVFSTIAAARITSAASSVGAVKTAVAEFAGKYGPVPYTTATSRVDDLLFTDGLLEGRFTVKIGAAALNTTGANWTKTSGTWNATGGTDQSNLSRIICVASTTTAPSTAAGSNFRLKGDNTNLPAGTRVISAVIVNLTGSEARELSLRIDGEINSAGNATAADNAGKVVYNTPAAGTGLTTAYIYVAHQ